MYCLTIGNIARSWERNKAFHRRNDLPAIEFLEGHRSYYFSDFFFLDGVKYFFTIQENGTKEYYNYNDRLHNLNGPAVIYANGDFEYWIWGYRHREDGPAVVYGNKRYWFINGEFIKEENV